MMFVASAVVYKDDSLNSYNFTGTTEVLYKVWADVVIPLITLWLLKQFLNKRVIKSNLSRKSPRNNFKVCLYKKQITL